jgi:hypothetical protein
MLLYIPIEIGESVDQTIVNRSILHDYDADVLGFDQFILGVVNKSESFEFFLFVSVPERVHQQAVVCQAFPLRLKGNREII